MTIDPDQIARTLAIFIEPGKATEARALEASTNGARYLETFSGYFNDAGKLAESLSRLTVAKSIYFIPNASNPALLSRAVNRIRPTKKEPTTADHDIIRRRWLLVDADPVRPSGISSSDAEHTAAIDRVKLIRSGLRFAGWPEPVLADSGNGGHLAYRIDVAADDGGLVERTLAVLAARYSDDAVKIDTTVFNPARIWKLYGTPVCKGDSTPDRPHRMARLLEVPDVLTTVSSEQLAALAAQAPVASLRTSSNGGNFKGHSFDVAEWIRSHNVAAEGPEPWKGGERWVFPVCPWNPDHTNRSAFILKMPSGAAVAGCHHEGCKGRDWHSLRDLVEPGWREWDKDEPIGSAYDHEARRKRQDRRSATPSVGSVSSQNGESVKIEPWPDPLPLPPGLPEVLPFDYELLPESLRPWIYDIAHRMQCPPDYCATTAMVAAAALIGRKVAIRPKRHDDWTVVPNLYGANVGRPSMMKSPAMNEVLKFHSRLEAAAADEFAKATAEHEAAALVAEAVKKNKKEEMKKTLRAGGDAQAIAASMADGAGKAPTRRRYMANDTTVEKAGVILAENPNGFLLYVDELASFLRQMDREGHEADRGFYLMAWNGDSRYTYDRIGRGTVDIEAAIVSIIGSIQPGVIADYLRGAIHGGAGDDGLMQRFQMTVWPDALQEWQLVDRYPESRAKANAHNALKRLVDLTPLSVESERDTVDDAALPFLRFDRDAQAQFNTWLTSLETGLRRKVEHPAIESHLSKYKSLIPSLALTLHLLDGGIGAIPLAAVERATKWGVYLESHARRLYAGITEAPAVAARLLARRIQDGSLSSGFASRDVYRNGWAGLDRERTESAIDVLLSLHWLEERTENTPGRVRTRYAINPKIEICPSGELTKPTKDPSVSSVGPPAGENQNFGMGSDFNPEANR